MSIDISSKVTTLPQFSGERHRMHGVSREQVDKAVMGTVVTALGIAVMTVLYIFYDQIATQRIRDVVEDLSRG